MMYSYNMTILYSDHVGIHWFIKQSWDDTLYIMNFTMSLDMYYSIHEVYFYYKSK